MEKVRTVYPDRQCASYEEWRRHIRRNLIILRKQIQSYELRQKNTQGSLQEPKDPTY